MNYIRTAPIAVAIFESNPVLCEALCAALSQQSGLFPGQGVWSDSGQAALSSGEIPDVVLIDPLALDAQPSAVRQNAPDSALIAYFAGTERERERNCAKASLAAGFRGLMTKQARSEEIATAVLMVSRGGYYVDGSFSDMMLQSHSASAGKKSSGALLTDREMYVIKAVARGMSMKEIGGELDLSSKTVETYKARASSKLSLHSRRDIVEYAIRSGWIQSVA